jgi:hypothetical protein
MPVTIIWSYDLQPQVYTREELKESDDDDAEEERK